MRKERKTQESVTLNVANQSYHERDNWNVNYAFQGFTKNKYFTSDRTIELNERFERLDGKELKGFGLEIEQECFNRDLSRNGYLELMLNYVEKALPNDLFKHQNDGSLNSVSTEAITQVMTKEFIRNHYQDFREYFRRREIIKSSSTESGNCGMHVNISNACFGRKNEIENNIKKLIYFVNKHYNFCCNLFKRSINHTDYCGRMIAYNIMDNAKKYPLESAPNNHGICLNLSHYKEGRIELRLVGGQADYYAFRNTMECVFHLIEKLKELKWEDLDDLVKVFSGCNQFVVKRLDDCLVNGTLTRSQHNAITDLAINVDFGQAGL